MESSNQVHLGNLWKDWTERESESEREKALYRSTVFLVLCSSVKVFIFFFFGFCCF